MKSGCLALVGFAAAGFTAVAYLIAGSWSSGALFFVVALGMLVTAWDRFVVWNWPEGRNKVVPRQSVVAEEVTDDGEEP